MVTNLRCEYLHNPLGVDTRHPRLSWNIQLPGRNDVYQSAYQIQVTNSSKKKIWDSGKVISSESDQISYEGPELESGQKVQWRVRAWEAGDRAQPWSQPAYWGVGLLKPTNWVAQWIGRPIDVPWKETESQPSPILRKTFAIEAEVARATAYVSAMGLYELRINGQKVGDHALAPEWTDYNKRIQYQAYDVTDLLRKGDNAVGAILGQGWYAGRIGMADMFSNGGAMRGVYGRHLRLIAQIEIEMTDGKRQTIFSDPTWKFTVDGPIRESDLLEGENYDARREIIGWDLPTFNDAEWKETIFSHGPLLISQRNEPIKITRELPAIAVSEPTKDTFIYDLGQNMVGWSRVSLKAPVGTEVRLRFGEVVQDDGSLYRDNLRGATQVDNYICKGKGVETFEPRFAYHGFRYIEITGLKKKPALSDVTGCVLHSSGSDTGDFTCSDAMLTKIMAAIQWTQRGNLHSTPTDCPQRDERMGWMGDIQVFSQTACFNMDMAGFFTKWLQDVRDAQNSDGRFPDFAPHPYCPDQRFSGNPGWADAGVIVPWRAYVNYGDVRLLEESYPSAQRWIEFVLRHNPDRLWQAEHATSFVYGDWLNGDSFRGLADWPTTGGELPKEIYATAFFAYSTGILAKMAKILGLHRDTIKYDKLARGIREAFCQAYVSQEGRIAGDTQAGYALALHFDLLPDALRSKAASHLVEALKPYKGSMSTGIQSTLRMMLELTRHGYHEEAYHLINKKTMPSWGYMVEHGGTTIWERWDGWVEGRGFQDPNMNSFNHYAIGAVGEWMWRTIIGISPDEKAPGWQHFFIQPIPGGGLTSAEGTYRSIKGAITVAWEIKDGSFTLKFEIPENTTATVQLPGSNARNKTFGSGQHILKTLFT